MHSTVLIEKIGKGKYRASTSQPIALSGEGKTRDEAIERLQSLARTRLSEGELIQVELVAAQKSGPWVKFAGVWKDHPEFETFRADIDDRRSRED